MNRIQIRRPWLLVAVLALLALGGCVVNPVPTPGPEGQVLSAKDAAAAADVWSPGAGTDTANAPDVAALADVAFDAGADAVDSAPDAIADAGDASIADVAPDVAADVATDVAPDAAADAGEDAQPDVVPDAIADAVKDALSDASQDAVQDALADAADGVPLDVPGGITNIDLIGVDWTCEKVPDWQLLPCLPGVVTAPPLLPGIHVDLPYPITYTDSPPSSGTHRPVWGKWGEYSFLPEQRWLHNAEHGGLVFLYHPCAPPETIAALRAFAKAVPPDDGGPFRWVMTPYPNLPNVVGVVGWGHVYVANCVAPLDLAKFVTLAYRKAPEDEPWDGGYSVLWLGK